MWEENQMAYLDTVLQKAYTHKYHVFKSQVLPLLDIQSTKARSLRIRTTSSDHDILSKKMNGYANKNIEQAIRRISDNNVSALYTKMYQ